MPIEIMVMVDRLIAMNMLLAQENIVSAFWPTYPSSLTKKLNDGLLQFYSQGCFIHSIDTK
jgi:hypothetical protein